MNHLLINVSLSTALWTSCWTSEAPVLHFGITAIGVATIPKPKTQMEIILSCPFVPLAFSNYQVVDPRPSMHLQWQYFLKKSTNDLWTMITLVWLLWKDALLPPPPNSQINLIFLLPATQTIKLPLGPLHSLI